MWFDSFYVSMLSEQYKNGKGNILKAVIQWLYIKLKSLGRCEEMQFCDLCYQ